MGRGSRDDIRSSHPPPGRARAEGEGWKVIDGAKTERRWLVFQARAPCVGTRGAVREIVAGRVTPDTGSSSDTRHDEGPSVRSSAYFYIVFMERAQPPEAAPA